MRAFLISCLAIVLIAVGAHYTLAAMGFSSANEHANPGTVRLDGEPLKRD